MEKERKNGFIIAIIAIVASLTAAVTAFLVIREKKKKRTNNEIRCSFSNFTIKYQQISTKKIIKKKTNRKLSTL